MQIEIIIREKIARTVDKHAFAVCGNSDYTVKFDFDSEWDSYETKTARFKYNGSYTDVPFSGDTCPMPVITNAYRVEIGVYAGELHTSSPALLPLRRSILDGDETESEPSQEIKDNLDKMLAGKIDVPQVAQVGEVLTVEEVDEDGKPTKWKAAKSGTFVCTFNDGEDGWITCDKTVEEIITANNDGKDVIGHYYGDIYRLSTPFDGNPVFSNLGVGVLSIIVYDVGHFEINRIRLSDIAPEDIPNSYEVPVYVPTENGMQWQYGRPLLAIDYAMNELTDEEKALMQKNLGIDNLGFVKYTEQELTVEQQQCVKKNIGAGTLREVYYWKEGSVSSEHPNSVIACANYGDTCICGGGGRDYPAGMTAPILVIYGDVDRGYRGATAFDGSNATWTFTVNLRDYSYSTPVKISGVPSPATAQVGQIVKVKAVDESGKITETEAVDMPMQKTLKWITVHSSDLTETKREFIISTDTDGKSIADYNPVGLSLILSTPADATVESNNGSPWVYPSATKADNAIRVIGFIPGWKTIARDSAFIFNGSSSAVSCTGNVNTSLPTYKLDGYALDGVRIFFNSANDHLPVGTHVEVAILCEVEE